ncbi:MAG TPA: hypothetical protein VK471_05775 [Solirubrobacterales bacterium]|nr:hypothetical protein [Solirubrobacterales bacterium]
MWRRAVGQKPGDQAPFPKSTPPGINYAVVTGTLISDPIKDKGPGGEPLTLLEIKFPVAHPEDPRLLWTYAFYDVQVPAKVGGRDIEDLREGATVLVAGQLSQRPDRIDEQAAIVAMLVKPGPRPEPSYPSQ